MLITGHTGFKGAWLSLWLQAVGSHVSGYSLSPMTTPNLFESANVAEGMRSRIADIRDSNSLRDFMEEMPTGDRVPHGRPSPCSKGLSGSDRDV